MITATQKEDSVDIRHRRAFSAFVLLPVRRD